MLLKVGDDGSKPDSVYYNQTIVAPRADHDNKMCKLQKVQMTHVLRVLEIKKKTISRKTRLCVVERYRVSYRDLRMPISPVLTLDRINRILFFL